MAVIIGAEANTLDSVFRYYYKHDLRMVNITVNLTQDKKIALSAEDESCKRMKHLLRQNILTLDEFLRHIPSDMTVNIDVRRYGGKQNAIPNTIICRIIMATKKRGKKNVIYSSCDKEIARIALCNRRDAWLTINDENILLSDLSVFSKISVSKDLIPCLLGSYELFKDKDVYIHNVSEEDWITLKNDDRLKFVKGICVKL